MTSKQRSNLRSIAAMKKPLAQIGKDGLGENALRGILDALEAHELVKVNLLPASGEDAKATAEAISAATGAEIVAVTGRKAVFYRRSSRKDFPHIEF